MAKKLLSLILAAAMLLTASFVFSASAASVMRGDVDKDGSISSADARFALRGSVGLETLTADFIMRADVDANGTVESSDARTILRTSVNLDSIQQSECVHKVKKWEPVAQKDGSDAAYHKGVCALCGETVFADHTYELEITEPYTCTAPGKAIEKCVCGAEGDVVDLPAQHTWEDVAGTRIDATCEKDGSVDQKCAVCGKTKTERLRRGHLPGPEATCTTDQICTRCKKVLKPALGHKFKEGAVITATKGIRCDRCGNYAVPSFNDLVNVLKDGTHSYSGFKVTDSQAEQPKFTGLLEIMLNMIPKKEREQMYSELTTNETVYSAFISNRQISDYNFNLTGEKVVSKLKDSDPQSLKMEYVKGVDFIASLPNTYVNERNINEDLTPIKNTKLGDVLKVTVTFAPESNPKESAIEKIDSELGEIIYESSHDIGGLAGEMDIFGEDSMKMFVDSVASLTVTYYFDAKTNAPIAAHYDDTVIIDSAMNLYINDDGEIQKDPTGSMTLKMTTDLDSYYFFDDYFSD